MSRAKVKASAYVWCTVFSGRGKMRHVRLQERIAVEVCKNRQRKGYHCSRCSVRKEIA